MRIPFLDLDSQSGRIRSEFLEAVERLVDSNSFIGGSAVEEFESSFARYCRVPHCVALNSGTDALRLGLLAAGVEEGGQVITSPFTFIATAEAIGQTGRVVLADVNPETFTLCPKSVEESVTGETVGLLPVHIFGLAADVPALLEISEKRGLFLVEDASQAHGATVNGEPVGGFGRAAAFSFYPSKNLGAFGDAGALTTCRVEVDELVRSLRNHGQVAPYFHQREGFNSRMDTFQATALQLKLTYLDAWNAQRQRLARVYKDLLEPVEEVYFQKVPAGYSHVYHVLAIRAQERDELAAFLEEKGIDTRVIYPTPIHLMPAYQHLGYSRGDFPNAEAIARDVLCLPMFPGLEEEQVVDVCQQIQAFYS